MSKQKRGLGKGLEALFDASSIEISGVVLRTIPLSQLEPDPDQPRRHFDEAQLEALAESIRQHGLLQPLVVTEQGGAYRIVAGERRWRAARIAGLTELPVQVVALSPGQKLEVALVENLQREDLNPMEQAGGYRRLIEEFSLTQEEVGRRVGKSRPAVANALRLLQLPPSIQQRVTDGRLSEGHARTLIGLPEPQALQLAGEVAEKGLSVRQLERMVKAAQEGPQERIPLPAPRAMHAEQLAGVLSTRLGRKVKLSAGPKKGHLEIEFYDNEDLDTLLQQLGLSVEL